MDKLINHNKKWTQNELIVAFNLYCKTPFSKIDRNNKHIIELAGVFGRTPSSVSLKLDNFARLDPSLQKRNISGMSHGGKSDVEVWNEFSGNWEELAYRSEEILAALKNKAVEDNAGIDKEDLPLLAGSDREAMVKVRINQAFFRKTVLASYDNRCCITGIFIPELLIASHIVPWKSDEDNRTNPCNGLCLNALHDRAFDRGFMTITQDYTIKLAEVMKRNKNRNQFFTPFDGKRINMPQRFLPSREFIDYHNRHVFIDR